MSDTPFYADYVLHAKQNIDKPECAAWLKKEEEYFLQQCQDGFDRMIFRAIVSGKEEKRLKKRNERLLKTPDSGRVLQCTFCLKDVKRYAVLYNYRFVHKKCWAWQETLELYGY